MTTILANTITGEMALIPGLASVGPAMGLPLSVLASLVERPFYSLAGVRSQTIWLSLQANLVSLLIGIAITLTFACVTDALHSYDSIFVVLPFVSIAASIVIERWYLVKRTGKPDISWGWTIAGNVFSAALCVGMLFLLFWLRRQHPGLQSVLRPWLGQLYLLALIGSVCAFILAFVFGKPKASQTEAEPAAT